MLRDMYWNVKGTYHYKQIYKRTSTFQEQAFRQQALKCIFPTNISSGNFLAAPETKFPDMYER